MSLIIKRFLNIDMHGLCLMCLFFENFNTIYNKIWKTFHLVSGAGIWNNGIKTLVSSLNH